MQLPTVGELNRLVTIRRWQDVPNAAFGVDQTFDAGVQVWAKVEPVAGAIYYGTKQTGENVTHRFVIRYRIGITAEHVVEYAGVRYRIQRVSDMNDARRFTVIEAQELGTIS